MSDLKTQRNVAIGVAALAVAFVAGYVISSGGRPESSASDAPSARMPPPARTARAV